MRLIRVLQHPLIFAALLCAIFVNAAMQPARTGFSHSVVGEWAALLTVRGGNTGFVRHSWAFFAERESSGRWRTSDQELSGRPAIKVTLSNFGSKRTGFWSVTNERKVRSVTFCDALTAQPALLPMTDRVAILSAIDQSTHGWHALEPVSTLAFSGSYTIERTVWSGVANNVLVAGLFGVLGFSGWANSNRIVRLRRVQLNLCPNCKYDQSGVAASRCPECGAHLPVTPT